MNAVKKFRNNCRYILKHRPYSQISCKIYNKKDLSNRIEKTPIVSDVENGWYDWWEQNNFFQRTDSKEYFVMMLPPPNVTGKLHMGHAATCALQDSIIRWNQMCGRKVIWIPGSDHAGIATQVVVEKHLWETQKITRQELGKQRFYEEVLKWKDEKGEAILSQLRRLGLALSWDKKFFTLDQNISTGVTEAFTRLFENGLIYRDNYMTNWCPALQSAISDFEVEHMEITRPVQLSIPGHSASVEFGYLYDIKYRVVDSDENVTVSTTRPETVLGDTAIMVHPEDPKYTHLHGKSVVHPLRDDTIPIITDTYVKRDFGTGAVKVTPGHSYNDFIIGKRHNLPTIDIFDDRGWIVEFEDLQIQTQPRFQARPLILDQLVSRGSLASRKPHAMQLPLCMRTGDVAEHRLKPQWFLASEKLSKECLHAVESGELSLTPKELSSNWHQFLSNSRDWCLSRQLWWGHKIPVYWVSVRTAGTGTVYGSAEEVQKGESVFVAAKNEREAKEKGTIKLGVDRTSILTVMQEKDVLDTWFSSALLPLVVSGWPNPTEESSKLFPLSLMETGFDILFFWVARMVMLSLALTGKLPFHDVLLHGMICDAQGRKMSKSKGNVLDPMDVIDGRKQIQSEPQIPACGADGLRFALCSRDLKSMHIAVDLREVEQAHFFRNKIWQTFRFFLTYYEKTPGSEICFENLQRNSLSCVMDRWIMSQLSQLVSEANDGFASYDIYLAANAFRRFWYERLCDVYLESCKPRLWGHEQNEGNVLLALKVMWTCIHTGILSMSPFMPFLAEEIYGRFPAPARHFESVMQCSFPKNEEFVCFRDKELDAAIKSVLEAACALRDLGKTYNVPRNAPQGRASILVTNPSLKKIFDEMTNEIPRLSFISNVEILDSSHDDARTQAGVVFQPVSPDISVQLHLQGVIDPAIERERIEKKIAKITKNRERYVKKSGTKKDNGKYVTKINELDEELGSLNHMLKNIEKL